MSPSQRGQGGGMFPFLSAVSGGSLVVFGGLSAALTLAFWSWSGLAISLALVAHGAYELAMRRRLLRHGDALAGRRMGTNQILLAVSVSLYAAFQAYGIDASWADRAAESSALGLAIDLYPSESRERIVDALPRLAWGFYALVAVTVWIGCGATAIYYRREARKR